MVQNPFFWDWCFHAKSKYLKITENNTLNSDLRKIMWMQWQMGWGLALFGWLPPFTVSITTTQISVFLLVSYLKNGLEHLKIETYFCKGTIKNVFVLLNDTLYFVYWLLKNRFQSDLLVLFKIVNDVDIECRIWRSK